MKKVFIIIFISFIFFTGCKENKFRRLKESSPWKNKTYDSFVKQVRVFPYAASEEKRQRLMTNYLKLSVGMTRKQVALLMGDPDIEDTIHSKLDKPGFMGWYWRYCVYKLEEFGQNLKCDKEISIFFDTEDKIEEVHALNIPNLPYAVNIPGLDNEIK